MNKKTYNGIINVNDQQAQANVKGLIDFSTSKIKADVLADIKHLNISHFTGQKTTQIAKGQINGKMEMSNLNDLVMDTKIDNLAFTNGNEHYNLPNAELKAYFNNGNRVLQIDAPNILNGRIAGKYNLAHLPDMLQNGIGKILVGSPVKKNFKGESFNMEIFAHQTLINLFEPNLQINDGVRVSGSYEGNDNTLVLNVDAKKLLYLMTKTQEVTEADRALAESNPNYRLPQATTTTDSLAVDNILVKINTANREEPIFTKIERLKMGENVFKNISLTGKNEDNKVMHISANFLHGSPQDEMAEQMKPYAINLNQSTNTNGDYIFKFSPTQVKFNEVAWNIDTSEDLNHSITYQKKTGHILVHNLRIFSDNSSLMLKDALFKSGKDFHIDGDVQNLQLAKLMEMQQSGNQMDIQGVANGNFNITMDKSHLQPVIDLDIDNITMSGKEVGKIVLNAKNSNTANVFDVDAKIISDGILGKNNLQLSGTINNNTSRPTLNLKANLDEFDLTFAQQFVKDVFGNIRGKASGDLNISGALNDIDYNGDIALKNFGMKINFIGVDYTFEDTIVNLSKGRAILNDIGIKDGRSNSAGSISGVIDFETLSTMAVQLIMRADNLLVLNTKQKDFDLFWGRVYGKGNLYVSGLVSALSFTTDLQEPFRALNGSQFTFNAGSTSSVNEFGMLRFLKRESDGQVKVQEKEKTGANLNLDFNIAVEKGTTVNVILPQDVGNITVKGDANPLRFRMFPNGNISMNGSYMVDSGTFVSKAILERTFQIQRGSTMRWDGNAMTPALDIKAQYSRMVTNTGQYLGTSLPAVNIELGVDITGSLNGPKIGFNISAPDLSSQMKETLSSKLNSENEKIIQFGSILLMNSFNVQTGTSSGFDFDATSAAESTAFNLAFKQLGSVLNTISNQFQINLDYLKGDANSISNTGDRANANVDFFISPRVTLKTGLGVPITKGTTTADTNYLSGEGIVEYDWSKKNDKSRLFRIYSRPSNIGLVGGNAGNGANQSYGVGVVYSKSFDTIFKQKNKKKNTDSIKINNNSTKN
ncbi:MAG: translocation/assembly module TamB domain-containing protein, partial [Bergeyella zoohelcum]|nr:translocation/assembly module TamB domain-containing protein [Bergeyella zoohelcum]